jgi:hypothetical protein
VVPSSGLDFWRRKVYYPAELRTEDLTAYSTLPTLYRLVLVIVGLLGPGQRSRYGDSLDGPGIESRWGRDIPHPSRPALKPTQPPIQWVPGLPRG